MWLDSQGVTHTAALPDPSSAMSPETVASLDALSEEERARVVDVLDDFWEDCIASSRTEGSASVGPEGTALPDGFVTATIESAEAAVAVVKATEPAWRLDVLEAIQDYLEHDE